MPPYHYDTDVGIQELKHDKRLSRRRSVRSPAGWTRAPRSATRRPAAPGASGPTRAPSVSPRILARPTWCPSDPYTVPADGQDLWWRPLGADRADRGPLHPGDRDQAVGPRARQSRTTRTPPSASRTNRATWSTAGGSRSTRSASSARWFRRVRLPHRAGQLLSSPGTSTTTRWARGRERPGRDRALALPGGLRAEYSRR
jgi:hypothetical protein